MKYMNAATMLDVLPKVVRYVREDLGKRFSLTEPWELNLCEALPGEYVCKDFSAKGKKLVFFYESLPDDVVCDGATLIPEEILGEPTVIAALAHDPLYRHLNAFAVAMGWSRGRTRKFFDKVFGAILLGLARRVENPYKRKLLVVNAYAQYAGVRALGGIARWLYDAAAGFAMAIFIALPVPGCSLDGVIEQDWEMPHYTQEDSRAVSHAMPCGMVTNAVQNGGVR